MKLFAWASMPNSIHFWAACAVLAMTLEICGCWIDRAALAQGRAAHKADAGPRQVIAGVPRSWPPQYSLDENGNPTGFAIDIMNEIAELAGIRVTYQVMENFAEVGEAMRHGRIDLIPNSGITPERAAEFAFTSPVETFVVSVFVRDDTLDIGGPEDLADRRVAVVEFNIGHALMKNRKDVESVVFRNAETALFSLIAGQVDAFVFPEPVLLNLARQVGIENRIKVVSEPLKELKRGIRVQKHETELLAALNGAVERFVGTPDYQAFYVKWYGRPTSFWTAARALAVMSGVLFVVLIGMAWWRYHSVVELNSELEKSIAERERADVALRESEERFRAFNEYSPTKIHIKDRDGHYLLINRLSEKLFGVTNGEAVGKTSSEIFPKEMADPFAAHDREVIETGKAVEKEEVFYRKDGPHTFLTVKFPIRRLDGDIVAVGSIGTDITERKMAEKVVLKAMEEAELANRAKSEFLANMSHELRTPLNAIIGFAEVIQNEILGPVGNLKYRDYATDISESGQHLLELINDILDLSKIESGAVELWEEDLDVLKVVRSSVLLLKERAQSGGVGLEPHIPEALPALRADRRRFKQILVNLLSNAVKFTPRGGTVTIKAWYSLDNGYFLQVADTGIGIAFQEIGRALAPFHQVDSRLNRKYEGSGLGLPLTKSLVELHGGTLDLQSKVGAGTTVTVRLPAARIVSESSTAA